MRDYIEAVVAELKANGYDAKPVDVEKANGVTKSGITIKYPDSNVGATIYLDDVYENGASPVEAAKEVVRRWESAQPGGMEIESVVECMKNYDTIRDKLYARLYNKSTKAEVFRSAKKYGFDDLIIVPVVNLETEGGTNGSVRVTKELLEKWGVDKKTVFKDALDNTTNDVRIEGMFETLMEMGLPEELVSENPLRDVKVVSNNKRMFGASAILGALDKFRKMSGGLGFIVIPSSIHEVLVVPNNYQGIPVEYVTEMVQEVNRTTVAPEEQLSDKAYSFA